jgi:hypothetical protein
VIEQFASSDDQDIESDSYILLVFVATHRYVY